MREQLDWTLPARLASLVDYFTDAQTNFRGQKARSPASGLASQSVSSSGKAPGNGCGQESENTASCSSHVRMGRGKERGGQAEHSSEKPRPSAGLSGALGRWLSVLQVSSSAVR